MCDRFKFKEDVTQSAKESSAVSGGIIEKIVTLFPFLQKGEEMSVVVESLQHIVRSFAHLTIFFALGSSVSAFICTYEISGFLRFLISQIFCILFAVSDEYHQKYVPGRSCQLTDMLTDSLGSALGIAFVLLVCAPDAIPRASHSVVAFEELSCDGEVVCIREN